LKRQKTRWRPRCVFSRHFSDVVDLAVVLHAAGGLMQPADRADMFATVTASKSSPIFLFLGSIILLNSSVIFSV
jgi:hypothetical protein